MISIPLAVDGAPFVDQVVNLDGTEYLFAFRFNQREGRYYLTLGDPNGTAYASGEALVCNLALFSLASDSRMPPGLLVILPQGPDDSPPGLGEIGPGKRCELIYFSRNEFAALGIG